MKGKVVKGEDGRLEVEYIKRGSIYSIPVDASSLEYAETMLDKPVDYQVNEQVCQYLNDDWDQGFTLRTAVVVVPKPPEPLHDDAEMVELLVGLIRFMQDSVVLSSDSQLTSQYLHKSFPPEKVLEDYIKTLSN